ncbi:MAG: hypothetical protein SFV52_00260 [Saprospiraceae bacterium]|nr:hypothetical protein [Saprospiraceae bacterium]
MNKLYVLLLAGLVGRAPTIKAETEVLAGQRTPKEAITFLTRLEVYGVYQIKQWTTKENQRLIPEKQVKSKKNAQRSKPKGKTRTGGKWLGGGIALLLLCVLLLYLADSTELFLLLFLALGVLLLSIYHFARALIYWMENPKKKGDVTGTEQNPVGIEDPSAAPQDKNVRTGNTTLVFGVLGVAVWLLGFIFANNISTSIIPLVGVLLGIVAIIAGIVQLKHFPPNKESRDRKKVFIGLIMGALSVLALFFV